MRVLAVVTLAGCAHASGAGPVATLRPACGAGQFWNGRACAAAGDAPQKLAAGAAALAKLEVDEAKADLDRVEAAGPLDHETNVGLWEQRGIAAAYLDDETGARKAFEMLLALDPSHFLSYTLSPKATFVFEKVLVAAKGHPPPAIDVGWSHDGRVGDPIPLDVEVLADPKQFLNRATVFVRRRGDSSWRAADVALTAGADHRVVLPAVEGTAPASLELYLRAYDDQNNEVLTWADPKRPREIPLRYDPPVPWYRTWWGITAIGGVVALGAGITVYELTLAPPDKIDGSVVVK